MKTRITELLKINYPIIGTAMSFVTMPKLVAAISNAGGLGILGSSRLTRDELRASIKEVRALTDKPFGVSVMEMMPGQEEAHKVIIEEGIPVVAHGLGNAGWLIRASREHDCINIPTVGSVKQALRAEQDGADAVILHGAEGGGHSGYISTMVLVPLVASHVNIPVIASGGFCDGRGLAAALALGATGIGMGTRFAITKESPIPMNIKQWYLRARAEDARVTAYVTGTRNRGIRNKLIELLEMGDHRLSWRQRVSSSWELKQISGVPLWRFLLSGLRAKRMLQMSFSDVGNMAIGGLRAKRALIDGDEDLGYMPCGQVCGRIDDIPAVQELIERIVGEAPRVLEQVREQILASTSEEI